MTKRTYADAEWRVTCHECEQSYTQRMTRDTGPRCCGACGSTNISVLPFDPPQCDVKDQDTGVRCVRPEGHDGPHVDVESCPRCDEPVNVCTCHPPDCDCDDDAVRANGPTARCAACKAAEDDTSAAVRADAPRPASNIVTVDRRALTDIEHAIGRAMAYRIEPDGGMTELRDARAALLAILAAR